MYVKSKRSGNSAYYPFTKLRPSLYSQLWLLKQDSLTDHYLKKYLYTDIDVPKNFDIIDCGAYVGHFSNALITSGHTGRIFPIEPSPRNFVTLSKNLHGKVDPGFLQNVGFSNVSGFAKLNLSHSGDNDSLIGVDTKFDSSGNDVVVKVVTVEEFACNQSIEGKFCLLKLEAEGFEIEILQGFGEFRPRYVTIDIGPERYGNSPYMEVKEILKRNGYKVFSPNKDSEGNLMTVFAEYVY